MKSVDAKTDTDVPVRLISGDSEPKKFRSLSAAGEFLRSTGAINLAVI